MDSKRFTDDKTGELRRFVNPVTEMPDWLFLPNEVPPNWEFPQRLWPLLADVKQTLGTLDGIGRTLPNPDLLLRPLQNREAITSSQIEGTYVTAQQLLLYELDPREPSSPDEVMSDWMEVSNYRQALVQGCTLIHNNPILNRDILAMHKTLMRGVRGARKSPGELRHVQVQLGAAGRYVPPPPMEVPRLMGNLEKYINDGDERFDPLVIACIVHYQIEAIHPFSDGNGRIGRVLLALMIFKYAGHAMPWLYMSAFFEQHRTEYTDHLLRISTHGDWGAWVEFCLVGMKWQAGDSIRRCMEIGTLRDQYHERVRSIATPRSHDIINSLFESPVLNAPIVAKRFNVTYKTAQTDLKRLSQAGILRELPNSRPMSFYATELFKIAYSNGEDDTTDVAE